MKYIDELKPSIFHPISKKKAWLWNANMWNDGSDIWEFPYMKPEHPKPHSKIYSDLP